MKKKNALRKDFFMEIRKSLGRFLSIFFIVALGVSLFVGIRSTQPDMILSGDAYTDENQLMDIKIVSTYGLTEEDADVIEGLPSIEMVEGSYSVDTLCESGDSKKVMHVMALSESMNYVTVTEGRLPENEQECLVDVDFLESSEYEIGDKILLEAGDADTDLTDTLKMTEFEIVGSGVSPLYFSFDRGSSTIGNGSVSGFLIVKPEAFSVDVFTELYARVEGAQEARSFTEEYDALIEEAMKEIALVQNARCEIRRDDLAQDAQLLIDDARKELEKKKSEAEKELELNEQKLDAAQLEIMLGKLQLEGGKTELKQARQQIEDGKAQIASGKAELEKGKQELEAGKQELEAAKVPYGEAMKRLEEEKTATEAKLEEWKQRLETMEPEEAELGREMIAALEGTMVLLDAEMEELSGQIETEFAAGEAEIAAAEKLIKEKEKELLAAEKELLVAERELEKAEKKLKDSEKDLQSGEHEISSGKTELEEAKEEMENQIQEGEEELEKAEEEIGELELPVWYVFDRSSIPEYNGYGDNADRIAALAIVFPSLFFLVAALISLTTMTRMVEEQRVQIGTLKALGYSKLAIMKKYLYYALAATLGGSIFGVLVGEKLFPFVIIVAYKIVYIHIPQVLIPYHWGYGAIATLIAVLCTGGATIASCYKELIAQPAVLMRPEAPKIGKRTLIEKIPFLWKHLSFTWKSTLRNLFRYKKRFFMTLFGIGGCMGLLMVGFGLRDSITSIATYQYGELQLYDSSVFMNDQMETETRAALEEYLTETTEVKEFMNARMESVTTKHEKEEVDVYLTVLEPNAKMEEFFVHRDRKTKKDYPLKEDGVILTEKAADLLNVKKGDRITLTGNGKNEQKVKVTAICENYAGHYVYMTAAQYEQLYGNEPIYNNLLLKANESVSMEALQKIGEELLQYEDVLNVQYTESLSGTLNDMLYALDQVMGVLIAVAGMLSFVVLYNLNNINITERRRELATLKVLGFYDGEVAAYVFRENILLTILGTGVGCVMGKFLHLFTIKTVEVDMAMFGRQIFPKSYLYGALFTVGFSLFVNAMMYFKLKKINMVESLKSVE